MAYMRKKKNPKRNTSFNEAYNPQVHWWTMTRTLRIPLKCGLRLGVLCALALVMNDASAEVIWKFKTESKVLRIGSKINQVLMIMSDSYRDPGNIPL